MMYYLTDTYIGYLSAHPLTLSMISVLGYVQKSVYDLFMNSITDGRYQCSAPRKQTRYVSVRLNLFCSQGSTYIISSYTHRYASFPVPVPLASAVNQADLEHIIQIIHV